MWDRKGKGPHKMNCCITGPYDTEKMNTPDVDKWEISACVIFKMSSEVSMVRISSYNLTLMFLYWQLGN
jgi:hypothetical protein